VKHRIAFYFISFFLAGFLFDAANATGQTIGYRQANLASSLPGRANNVAPGMTDPWGIAFLSGQPFFVADNQAGHATVLDATGLGAAPGGFAIPNASGNDHPTGIVADQNSSFGSPALLTPFVLVTAEGTVFTWGPDARGDLPSNATRVIDSSARGAVYEGVAILNSALTQPALAITDFHGGFVDTFIAGFLPVALPGSFTDPNLPAGYAPFGIQVIGRQVFITYSLQDSAKHDPVLGAGNGIVNIFDMDGNFVKRFATGGALNAPWGIAQAGANFGPFGNDILIGNVGDGTINAFDPTSGNFVGTLIDGDGSPITEIGLHGLAFRSDGFGDPNTLYFTSQLSSENDGLFGAITTGLVDTTRVTAPEATAGTNVEITASVAAGPGNLGTPTGTVTFFDGANRLGTSPLVDGQAIVNVILSGLGVHAINAQYSGDANFLPSSDRIPLQVSGIATATTLLAPANAAPDSSITLTATITSAGGIPTGQVVFLDGRTSLGSAPLSDAGVAILRTNSLSAGTHILTASYGGDEKFAGSASAGVTIDVANEDFSVAAVPSTATVLAGNSTQFTITITPAGGFAGDVAFSCSPVTGISCAFNPATVTPTSGAATTTLTVTTSASVPHYGSLLVGLGGLAALLIARVFLCILPRYGRNLGTGRAALLPATTALTIVALALSVGGCGGYGNGAVPNRGTASIVITAQAGSIAHTSTIMVTVQ
jgi:uncharacterized protein (TIGR03118 family)